jgi:hypothetical protein
MASKEKSHIMQILADRPVISDLTESTKLDRAEAGNRWSKLQRDLSLEVSEQGDAPETTPFSTHHRVSFAIQGIAASDQLPPFRILDVEGISDFLMIQPHNDKSHATVSIFDENYEFSTSLDGTRLAVGDQSFTIQQGKVVVPLHETCLEFRLISTDGQNIPLRGRA